MGVATAAGLGVSAATSGMSFYQASQQRKLQREAEGAAKTAMEEAKKKLDINFYDKLGIVKEPYQLEREANMSIAAQSILAGVESERGAAAVAGKVNMANNLAQRNIAGAMGQDVLGLNKLVASEDARLNMAKEQLDLGEATGAQLAARNYNTLANQSFMQGMEGVTGFVEQAAKIPALYKNDNSAEAYMALAEQQYNKAIQNNTLDPNYRKAITDANGKYIPFSEAFKNSTFATPQEYIDFLNNNITTQ